ncbi:Chondrolectin [Lonchura striata]|uniref:Chondrolectin n=1 Tax=Lonchura striata TaxID=40157 RepID=A0A218V9J1_9PASE|nr:Chondrolectin [Lonchura striata domestica]
MELSIDAAPVLDKNTAQLLDTSLGAVPWFCFSGQKVCYGAFKHSCYKLAYFQDLSRRVGFQEARQACEIDGGALLSLESEAEQQLIENMLQNLTRSGSGISDGDFWIGLWRSGDGLATSSACPDLYQWADGSMSPFRNWYTDEPSCGSEACVVMYHQPTANPGLGGPYLYQWNDDRCNMKHNFICKYAPDIFPTVPAGNPYDTSKPEDQYHIIATETGNVFMLKYCIGIEFWNPYDSGPGFLDALPFISSREARRNCFKDPSPLSSECLAESLNSNLVYFSVSMIAFDGQNTNMLKTPITNLLHLTFVTKICFLNQQ